MNLLAWWDFITLDWLRLKPCEGQRLCSLDPQRFVQKKPRTALPIRVVGRESFHCRGCGRSMWLRKEDRP
jgi:hypothetical protein